MTIILNTCQTCAEKAGSKPKPFPVTVWLGVCCGCGSKTGCTAPKDWTPPVLSFDARENERLNSKKVKK